MKKDINNKIFQCLTGGFGDEKKDDFEKLLKETPDLLICDEHGLSLVDRALRTISPESPEITFKKITILLKHMSERYSKSMPHKTIVQDIINQALVIACRCNKQDSHIKIIHFLLLEKKAEVNTNIVMVMQNITYGTALLEAIAKNNCELVDFLPLHGARLLQGSSGVYPLELAVKVDASPKIFDKLFEKIKEDQTGLGQKNLDAALAAMSDISACSHTRVLKSLLDSGANPAVYVSNSECTLLEKAIEKFQDTDDVFLLIEALKHFQYRNFLQSPPGLKAISAAVRRKDKVLLEHLLQAVKPEDQSFDSKETSKYSRKTIYYQKAINDACLLAHQLGFQEITGLLLTAGADEHYQNHLGQSIKKLISAEEDEDEDEEEEKDEKIREDKDAFFLPLRAWFPTSFTPDDEILMAFAKNLLERKDDRLGMSTLRKCMQTQKRLNPWVHNQLRIAYNSLFQNLVLTHKGIQRFYRYFSLYNHTFSAKGFVGCCLALTHINFLDFVEKMSFMEAKSLTSAESNYLTHSVLHSNSPRIIRYFIENIDQSRTGYILNQLVYILCSSGKADIVYQMLQYGDLAIDLNYIPDDIPKRIPLLALILLQINLPGGEQLFQYFIDKEVSIINYNILHGSDPLFACSFLNYPAHLRKVLILLYKQVISEEILKPYLKHTLMYALIRGHASIVYEIYNADPDLFNDFDLILSLIKIGGSDLAEKLLSFTTVKTNPLKDSSCHVIGVVSRKECDISPKIQTQLLQIYCNLQRYHSTFYLGRFVELMEAAELKKIKDTSLFSHLIKDINHIKDLNEDTLQDLFQRLSNFFPLNKSDLQQSIIAAFRNFIASGEDLTIVLRIFFTQLNILKTEKIKLNEEFDKNIYHEVNSLFTTVKSQFFVTPKKSKQEIDLFLNIIKIMIFFNFNPYLDGVILYATQMIGAFTEADVESQKVIDYLESLKLFSEENRGCHDSLLYDKIRDYDIRNDKEAQSEVQGKVQDALRTRRVIHRLPGSITINTILQAFLAKIPLFKILPPSQGLLGVFLEIVNEAWWTLAFFDRIPPEVSPFFIGQNKDFTPIFSIGQYKDFIPIFSIGQYTDFIPIDKMLTLKEEKSQVTADVKEIFHIVRQYFHGDEKEYYHPVWYNLKNNLWQQVLIRVETLVWNVYRENLCNYLINNIADRCKKQICVEIPWIFLMEQIPRLLGYLSDKQHLDNVSQLLEDIVNDMSLITMETQKSMIIIGRFLKSCLALNKDIQFKPEDQETLRKYNSWKSTQENTSQVSLSVSSALTMSFSQSSSSSSSSSSTSSSLESGIMKGQQH